MAKRRAPEPDADAPKPLAIELPADGLGSEKYWQDEIERSEKRRKKELDNWKVNLDRYKGQRDGVDKGGRGGNTQITVNVDFYNTEQKAAQLFFQTPAVQLTPQMPGLEDAAVLFQHVLNEKLGPNGASVIDTVDECLFDVICPSGVGPSEISYEAVTVQKQVPVNDPLTNQPQVDPTTLQPMTQAIPWTIWCKYAWDHFSPGKLLLPAGFLSTDYDAMPWIGRELEQDVDQVSARVGGKKDDYGSNSDDNTLAGSRDKEALRETTRVYRIWYKASLYDPSVLNPELIRKIEIVQTKKRQPVARAHEDSPYQKFDPATGEMLQGMRGFPIHPLCIRRVTDTQYPPSDCSISRPQVDELSMGRSQMLQQRQRNIPIRGVNTLTVDKANVQRMERGDWQGLLLFNGPVSDSDIREIAPAGFPTENFSFNTIVDRDIAKLWALDANQQGVTNDSAHTATELAIADKAKDTRLAKERARVLEWYIKGYEKFSTLLQMFADQTQLVAILGEDGAQRLAAWDKTQIQGRYAFSARPDSTVRIDAAEERAELLRAYNLMANDPRVNREAFLNEIAARFRLDPKKFLQQPPAPAPEAPKISISFKGELLPAGVQLQIFQQNGIQVSPNDVAEMTAKQMIELTTQAAQAKAPASRGNGKHGGAARPMQPISQHDADLTGSRPGVKPFS